MSTLKVGDKVAYSKKFLQNIADYSLSSASKRGTITKLTDYGDNLIIAEVSGDFKIKINVKNLVKESQFHLED